jgi:hypothetical protein
LQDGCILLSERVIPQLSLTTLYEQHVGPRRVDFMSVDIEGVDRLVALQLRLLPKDMVPCCLCIECNTEDIRNDMISTLSHTYRQHRKIGCNLIFWDLV